MKRSAALFLLSAVLIFLAFNKHSHDNFRSYHSVIWADGAGYHVYNPIWFIYGNNAIDFPPGIEMETGTGFKLDRTSNRVITKYTSGVAILQAPFFLAAHLLAPALNEAPDGFSPVYHKAIWLAGIFYGLLGLLFAYKFLKSLFDHRTALLTTATFLLCTNLYYYMLDASGMLHIYAFFLCAFFLHNLNNAKKSPAAASFLPVLLSLALLVLIRPIHIILVLVFILLKPDNDASFNNSRFFLNNWKPLIPGALASIIIFIPQLIYWSQSYGSAIAYSYGEEGFTYLFSPRIAEVWFAPNNGLFTYAPVILLAVLALIFQTLNKRVNSVVVLMPFLLLSWLLASWWNYWFGCSFGARGFVDYYPLLMIPVAAFLSNVKSLTAKITVAVFLLFCLWLNMDFIYYYDGCFYGGDWNWSHYLSLITD